jgi:phage protein U
MGPQSNSHMLLLGGFKFSVSTASLDKLKYVTNYRWIVKEAPTDKCSPLLQYNGPGERTLDIEGTIFPQLVKGGLAQVDDMRKEALKGKALKLCHVQSASGAGAVGKILGDWCIYSISEDRTLFTVDGNAREIHFSLQLKAFDL